MYSQSVHIDWHPLTSKKYDNWLKNVLSKSMYQNLLMHDGAIRRVNIYLYVAWSFKMIFYSVLRFHFKMSIELRNVAWICICWLLILRKNCWNLLLTYSFKRRIHSKTLILKFDLRFGFRVCVYILSIRWDIYISLGRYLGWQVFIGGADGRRKSCN